MHFYEWLLPCLDDDLNADLTLGAFHSSLTYVIIYASHKLLLCAYMSLTFQSGRRTGIVSVRRANGMAGEAMVRKHHPTTKRKTFRTTRLAEPLLIRDPVDEDGVPSRAQVQTKENQTKTIELMSAREE